MRMFKSNHVIVAGNIANVTIRNGTHGQFGSITVAVDDGYFKQGQNGQDGEWVDRTHFVECKVNANFLKKLKTTPDKGDMICLQGKLTLEKWKDNQGQERSALKVAASDVDGYIPKAGVIAMKSACSNQSNQQNGGYQQPQSNDGHNQQYKNNTGRNQRPQNSGGQPHNDGGNNHHNSGGYQRPQGQH